MLRRTGVMALGCQYRIRRDNFFKSFWSGVVVMLALRDEAECRSNFSESSAQYNEAQADKRHKEIYWS